MDTFISDTQDKYGAVLSAVLCISIRGVGHERKVVAGCCAAQQASTKATYGQYSQGTTCREAQPFLLV